MICQVGMAKAPKVPRVRIDKLLVDLGLCESRSKAQALVLANAVVVDDHAVDKPGTMVKADAAVRLKAGRAAQTLQFVSRAGHKLRGALDEFEPEGLDVRERVAMDVGASTGGFTDCLLQAGASKVFAVDVGYGQLAWKLAQDERVIVMDRQNIRHLRPEQVGEPVSLVVIDCSFISLTKILDAIPPLLGPTADLVALVKPQFEVGKERIGKGGIVRDADAREQARMNVLAAAQALGFRMRAWAESTLPGREGNQESLVWLQWGPKPGPAGPDLHPG